MIFSLQFKDSSDIMEVFEGTDPFTGKRVWSTRGNSWRQMESNLPQFFEKRYTDDTVRGNTTRFDQDPSTAPNVTHLRVAVFTADAVVAFRSRDEGGTHFKLAVTLSPECPEGMEFVEVSHIYVCVCVCMCVCS
jgi:hypothetical protein